MNQLKLQASKLSSNKVKNSEKYIYFYYQHLQKHLESRTFFVGNHLTFADFYMFTQLYDNVIEMTDEQKLQYNNLFRWYKHIQNLPQIRDYLTLHKRFLIEDPAPKYAFLAEKKKPKKEKK